MLLGMKMESQEKIKKRCVTVSSCLLCLFIEMSDIKIRILIGLIAVQYGCIDGTRK